MRIDFLLMTPDVCAGTERSIFTQAGMLAEHNRVRVVGVYRTAHRPHFAVPRGTHLKYLLDAREGDHSKGSSLLVPADRDCTVSAESERALVAYLGKTNADVLVTCSPALAALAVDFAPAHVRVVYQEHGGSVDRLDVTPLVSHGPRLDLIVCVTNQEAQQLRGRLGVAPPHMEVVPHALDAGFHPRTSLQNRTIISAGQLITDKRFAHLIKAFQTANELVPGWRLRIYGDGPLKSELRQAVWRSGLAGLVDIIPPTSRMAAELSKASIFALTSRAAGLPLIAIEAAAAGLPIVAFDIPSGPSSILGEGGGGLLVPDDEPVSFGVALAHLMSDREALNTYSEQARSGAAYHAAELIAGQWEDVYRRMSNRRPRRQMGGAPLEVVTASRDDVGGDTTPVKDKGVWLDTPRAGSRPVSSSSGPVADQLRKLFIERGLSHVEIGMVARDIRIGLDEDARAEVIEAIETVMSDSELTCIAQRGDAPLHVHPWCSREDRPPTVDYATVFRIMGPAVNPAKSGDLVDIELWRRDQNGTRFAPRRNDLAEWVDGGTWTKWTSSGAGTPTGARAWNEINFPIDAVFMWVDGADPAWDARRRARLAAMSASADIDENHDSVSSARFVSRDEIYYSVASVRSFMPWVRSVYIVTDGQVHQRVAADFPEVQFIDHRDIFPDPGVLPVFNSQAIESCLHRIPGLAEHFICFNDDVMVAKPITPDAFFQANGVARFFPSSVKINHGADSEAPHLQAGSNNRDIILKEFGFEITNAMLHTPLPHLRSVIFELESRYPEKFASTRSSSFRSPGDISALSSLAQYYGWATGRYVAGSLNYRYLRLSGQLLRYRMMGILQDQDLEIVALGEPLPGDRVHQDERGIVREFLETLIGIRVRPQ